MREIFAILLVLFVCVSWAEGQEYTHKEYFETYEGTKTCLECHEDEAEAFFYSQHYQWRGASPDIVNSGGKRLGKMNLINDFCTNPIPSWIGKAINDDGDVIARGCSQCHTGLGKMPSETISREQLENIDCLICHASGYKRDLYKDDSGNWEWKPILWTNQAGMDSVSQRIGMPTRTMCLQCHSSSGGSLNFKHGDLEDALADCERPFDVHMGTDGGDMHCVN